MKTSAIRVAFAWSAYLVAYRPMGVVTSFRNPGVLVSLAAVPLISFASKSFSFGSGKRSQGGARLGTLCDKNL